jgi:hypothetical protein
MPTRALLALTLIVAACRDRPLVTAPSRVSVQTAHFAIHSSGLDRSAVDSLGAFLERHRDALLTSLGSPAMPTTTVRIQSEAEFRAQWGRMIDSSGIGFQPQGLTGPDGTIYISGPWADQHTGHPLSVVALHELAHAATWRAALEHVAATGRDTAAYIAGRDRLGRSVRWLSETIALYEAGQSTDLNRFGYLWRARYPSIAQLNDPANSQIYDIGYRLGDFIEWKWGPGALLKIVYADGDVQRALGVTEAELMRQWFVRIEDRYLIVKPRWFGRRAERR